MHTQTAILDRAPGSHPAGMTPDTARYFLGIHLDPVDSERADELAAKARSGSLTNDKELEIEEYRRTGRTIEMLRIRASVVLNQIK